MKRSIVVLAVATLALGGCSGKSKEQTAPDQKAAATKAAKKGDEKPHVNPWAKDAPAAAAPPAAAPPAKKGEAKAKEETKANPWAKEQPAGPQPIASEKPAKK